MPLGRWKSKNCQSPGTLKRTFRADFPKQMLGLRDEYHHHGAALPHEGVSLKKAERFAYKMTSSAGPKICLVSGMQRFDEVPRPLWCILTARFYFLFVFKQKELIYDPLSTLNN